MKLAISLFLAGLGFGATPVATLRTSSDFQLCGVTVRAAGVPAWPVLDGDTIVSGSGPADIRFTGGAMVTLLPNSRARVYGDRTVLEAGSSVVRDGEKQKLEAATLQIAALSKDAILQIEMTGSKTVTVSTHGGTAAVRNAGGVLVANLRPDTAIAFMPQAAAPTAVKITGVLETKKGKFLLTDGTTNVTVQLQTALNVAPCQGKQVRVTGWIVPGMPAAEGASQVVQVTKVESPDKACSAHAGQPNAPAGAMSAFPAGSAAVLGGVAAAAAMGGLAAAGAIGNSTPPPLSRR